MPYFDRARVEYLRRLGRLTHVPGEPEFVMRAQHVEYPAPARFDDEVEVFVRVDRLGRTSVTWAFDAYRVDTGEHLVSATQTVVSIDPVERRRSRSPRCSATRWPGTRSRGSRLSPAAADYDAVAADIERLAATEEDSDAIVRGAVEAIHDRLDAYSWVGVYFVEGEELILGPWKGPNAADHVRIPIGRRIRGRCRQRRHRDG